MSVYVIAEAGVNHNGDIALAHEMIDCAADAKADAVKFQTFVPERLASRSATKAAYQLRNQPGEDSQLTMLQNLALSFEQHHELLQHCLRRKIDFLSSPFDPLSTTFLIDDLNLPTIKLGSGELTNGPLLWQLGHSGRRLILSTGMANLQEIHSALGLLCLARRNQPPSKYQYFPTYYDPELLRESVSLLHCTTEYPCPMDSVNLRAMDCLQETFELPVGYSDHTTGISVPIAAVARGARIIEKHFTLNRSLPGPDHQASLEPQELSDMVKGIRDIELCLGEAQKEPAEVELKNAAAARKSLCAARPIRKGDRFNLANLCAKRPGTGLSPMYQWQLLRRRANRDYAEDELIDPSILGIDENNL